jgi:hypothetical protein
MSQRHATDVVSLIFGIIFAGVVVVWALTGADLIDAHSVALAGPAILIAAGAVGLAVALRGGAQRG